MRASVTALLDGRCLGGDGAVDGRARSRAAAAAIRRSCTSYRTSTPVAAPDSAAGGGDATPRSCALTVGLKPPSALKPTPKPTLSVE